MSEGKDKTVIEQKDPVSNEEKEEEEGDDESEKILYIYKDNNESYPVIEYVEDEKNKEQENKNVKDNTLNKKDLKADPNLLKKEAINEVLGDVVGNIDTVQLNDDEPHFITFPEDYDAYVVKFYAPWCPHCLAYKPVYVSMAKELISRLTHEKVSFIALSCLAHENICMSYNISGYPTILGFRAGDLNETGLVLNGDGAPDLTADLVGKYLHLDLIFGKGEHQQIKLETDDEEEDDETKKDVEHALKLRTSVLIKKETRNAIIKQLHEHEYARSLSDVYSDAGKSLIFLLRSNIYVTNSRLSDERANAFHAWINLLDWTLPEEWGIRYSLDELKKEFQTIIQSKKNLISVLDRHKSSFWGIYDIPGNIKVVKGKASNELKRYSYGCTHGSIGPGYTCGLWQMFHIISIGASERYLMSYFDGFNSTTHHVADTIYNFVSNFFACDVCRNNFKAMYKSCGFDHCHKLSTDVPSSKEIAMELPIWLWKVHNGVNVRLIGERATRDGRNVTKGESAAAIWPTKKMCPNCRTYHGDWNHSVVYDFLRWKYWPGYDHLSSEFLSHDTNYFAVKNSAKSFAFVPIILFSFVFARYILSDWLIRRTRKHKKV